MAIITDYATLVTAVGDYLVRSDLSGHIPNFIQNCENKVYRSLRIRAMETALSGTIASGVLTVPTDYIELKHAYVNTSPIRSLERQTSEYVLARYPVRTGAGIPSLIAVDNGNFIFGPYPGDYDITGVYYKRLPSLSGSNTTNWFTTYAPELLLYGSLLEAQPFVMNDKRIPTWQAFYDRAWMNVQEAEVGEKHSGSNLAVRVG